MQTQEDTAWFFPRILMIEESCNLIGCEAKWPHPTTIDNLRCYLPFMTNSMQKTTILTDSFQRYWWSKILESDWLRAFWATTEEPRLCQVYRFQRIIMNIVMYHFQGENDTSVDKIFGKSQKTLFWRNFWAFLPKWDFFLKNLASSVYEFITLKIL